MLRTTSLLLLLVCSFIANSNGQDIAIVRASSTINSIRNVNGYIFSMGNERLDSRSVLGFSGVYEKNGTFPKKPLTTEAYISLDTVLDIDDLLIYTSTEDNYWATDCSKGCYKSQVGSTFHFKFDCNNLTKSGREFAFKKLYN